jgi:hypothetical protein
MISLMINLYLDVLLGPLPCKNGTQDLRKWPAGSEI